MLFLPQAAGLGRQAREQLGADKLAVEVENIEWDPRKVRTPLPHAWHKSMRRRSPPPARFPRLPGTASSRPV